MKNLEERLREHFEASIAAKRATLDRALPQVLKAAQALSAILKSGGKILSCGNGGSAADAQHFAAELTGRYERERGPRAGMALTPTPRR